MQGDTLAELDAPRLLASVRLSRWLALSILVLGFAVADAGATSKTDIRIGPGPTTMSAEEQSLLPNPATGEQHAVILVEEMERDENRGTQGETTFHVRAKILSNEGRDLANIELPYVARYGTLARWWGRTLLPNGALHELKEEQLEQQSVAQLGSFEVRALKAALPGVVPGAVIDYGYTMRHHENFLGNDRIMLQRDWPIRQLRYRWRPSQFLSAGYAVWRTEGLDVRITRDRESVLVEGRNLPAVPEEPWMPPEHEMRGSVTFYYADPGEVSKDYWVAKAKSIERNLRIFCGKEEAIQSVLAQVGIDPAASPLDKARKAYDWLGSNLKNTWRQSLEALEAEAQETESRGRGAARVLAVREGTGAELDSLFACLARSLGLEAYLVMVTDRRQHLWMQELPTMEQFAASLVALRPPGAQGLMVADPGSGLPFGEVPWRFTGASAFMATPQQALKFDVPPSQATRNKSNAEVELRFTDDNQSTKARWTWTASGQAGLDMQDVLRTLPPRESAELLEQRCGSSSSTEVLTAEPKGLDDQSAELALLCETERTDTHLDESIGRYSMPWIGPWVQALPELPPGRRHHPVIFDFPSVETVRIVMHAPESFVPREPPADVQFSGPYGKYQLRVQRAEGSYTVERALALLPLSVPASEYDALREFFDKVSRAERTLLEFERVAKAD